MGLKKRKSLHVGGSQGCQCGLNPDFERRQWAGNAGLRPPYAPQAVFAKIQNWHFFMGKILGFMHFCHISTLTLARRAKSNKISSFSPYLAILQLWRGRNKFLPKKEILDLFMADLFYLMVFSIWQHQNPVLATKVLESPIFAPNSQYDHTKPTIAPTRVVQGPHLGYHRIAG